MADFRMNERQSLVNLSRACPHIVVRLDPQSRRLQKLPRGVCYIGRETARALNRAQRRLPRGVSFMIWDGFRPRSVQRTMFEDYCRSLARRHPDWSATRTRREADRYIADPEHSTPHTTGRTIDVTLINHHGRQLDLGTPLDTFTRRSRLLARGISKAARANRRLLARVLVSAGFQNEPEEWWHWEYRGT